MNYTESTTIRRSVLIVGSGGREHALALACSRDTTVHCAPGNPGTAQFATNHPVVITDPDAIVALARDLGVDLVVIGPEAPLVAGVADAVRAAGIACFGPGQAAARLEGSKSFAKEVMNRAGVPTARSITCTTDDQLRAALSEFEPPYVVKLDGLAAGKGVLVTDDIDAAFDHGRGQGAVVVEEYLDGPEASLFVVTDGTHALPLQPAQDFKRVHDGDAGPNTGGMGAYSPLPWLDSSVVDQVMDQIVTPTLAQMRAQGTPFTGLLYVGLAITKAGPKVIEFNVRFGDPETEVVLPLLDESLADLLYDAATGNLDARECVRFRDGAAVCVVLAARGYPSQPVTGGAITVPADGANAHLIHAGTAVKDGALVANGGRVLVAVGQGDDVANARAAAYGLVARIDFPDGFCRRDIAAKASQAD